MNFLSILILFSTFEFSGFRWRTFENFDPRSKNQFTSKMLEKRGDVLIFRALAKPSDTGFVFLSSGIVSERAFSYGTFIFTVEGDLSNLKDACFAPFLYDFDAGVYEVDIEFSKWGNPLYPSGNYGIIRQFGRWYKPDSVKKTVHKFPLKLKQKSVTKHYLYWYPDSVVFASFEVKKGEERLIERWIVSDKTFVPNKPMYVEIYLWWPRNPKKLNKHEIKVLKFEYLPFKESIDKGFLPGSPEVPKVSD